MAAARTATPRGFTNFHPLLRAVLVPCLEACLANATAAVVPAMGRTLSTYLDLLRFSAAMVVFFSHLAMPHLSGTLLPLTPLVEMADAAVMAFFVLSGFVISYAAAARDRNLTDYAGARLARLWSVALPALLVAWAADGIGRHFDPGLYAHLSDQRSSVLVQLAASAAFANELWFASIRPFSNGPYWSIGYEFWYYALFAVGFFLRGRTRWIAGALLCALIGPKILALFPVWLLGAGAQRLRTRVREGTGWSLLIGSLAGVLAMPVLHASFRLYWWGDSVVVRFLGDGYSRHLPSKLVIGLAVAANLLGVAAVGHRFDLQRIERPARWLAGMTFSLYLFHYPLLHLYASVLPGKAGGCERTALLAVVTLLTVAALAAATERQKPRARRMVDALGRRLGAYGASIRRRSSERRAASSSGTFTPDDPV